MSWNDYITTLVAEPGVVDAAIWGYLPNQQAPWAAKQGGELANLTVAEVQALVGDDRNALFGNGAVVSGIKCTVVNDNLRTEHEHTMNLKAKETPEKKDKASYVAGVSKTALIVVKGGHDVNCQTINNAVYKIVNYLRGQGM